jgi:EAL domain-containing protein (putative c-di-GMP-specific phosphodiesterase class I)
VVGRTRIDDSGHKRFSPVLGVHGSIMDLVRTEIVTPDVELDRLLRQRDVRSVFQPLVDLNTGATVGYEALARGPAGSALESPAALFGVAYRTGRVPELDWVCRTTALRAAIEAQLHPALSLFVNSEPVSMRAGCPADLAEAVAEAGRLRVVMEVTERAVAADPAGLLAAIARARADGWGVALDDVGAEPASLAIMPFVRPDVIKLDLGLIQNRPTLDVARTVSAVLAQAERTGATVLAEGIETPQHADVARAMGATVGQGWLYGRPGPLPAVTRSPGRLPGPCDDVDDAATTTPFQVVAGRRPVSRVSKDLLMPMSQHLEHNGLDPHEPIVLLACFQEARHFTADTRRRFSRLAEHAAFVGAVGVGMPSVPAPGVRGGNLRPNDLLRGEWDVIAVGPHFAGALVARDCGDDGPDRGRRFDYAITHDRDLVIRAARALLATLVPAEPSAWSGAGGR